MNDEKKLYQTYELLSTIVKVVIAHFMMEATFVKFKQIDYFKIPCSIYCVELHGKQETTT